MHTAIQRFFMRPLHAGLLLLFFLLRFYQLNKGFVTPFYWGISVLLLLLLALICFGCSWLFSKQAPVRWNLTTLLLGWLLFFGVLQQELISIEPLAPISRLKYLLPLTAILVLLFCFWYGRRNSKPVKATLFLNIVFLLFIMAELMFPGGRNSGKVDFLASPPVSVTPQDFRQHPDIYLLLMDEYTGEEGTSNYFHFSNKPFIDSLQQLGFQVLHNSHSDYDYTVYSVASLLNMSRLNIRGALSADNTAAYQHALNAITDNRLCKLLAASGYQIHNKSLFRIGNSLPERASDYLPQDLELVFHPSLPMKLYRAFPQWMHAARVDRFAASWYKKTANANERILQDSAARQYTADTAPDFSYWHFNLPHEPYLYDADGKPVQTLFYEKQPDADSAYLHYLEYTNRRLQPFLRRMLEDTRGEAVILLLSDHGYRTPDKNPVAFSTLNAVYLPGRDSFLWPDSLHLMDQGKILLQYLSNPAVK